MRVVVTSGKLYLDIDGYACVVAYAELLAQQGTPALAMSTAPLNDTIPPSVRDWGGHIVSDYSPEPDDTYVVIDVSDPEAFDKKVDRSAVREVIDHHPGFEAYWREQEDVAVDIQTIGAACTQIYERWVEAGLAAHMSRTSARLLATGILDNTLNFTAKITTDRDRRAYQALRALGGLDEDWPDAYFAHCQSEILGHLERAIMNDSKILKFHLIDDSLSVGQLVMWDGRVLLGGALTRIEDVLAATKHPWFCNLVCIGDGKSYLIAKDDDVQAWLSDILGVTFDGPVATADRLWLRKEIIAADIAAHEAGTLRQMRA